MPCAMLSVVVLLVAVQTISARCPHIAYQEGDPSLPNVTTLSVYLDPSDDEFEESELQ